MSPHESETLFTITVITILHHSGELNLCPCCFLNLPALSAEPVCRHRPCPRGSTMARPPIDAVLMGAFPAQKPTAYLINAGLATTRHFITAFAKRAQPRLDWKRVRGVNVIVIESDYPIISSNPELSHSPSISLSLSLFIFLLVFHLSLVSVSGWMSGSVLCLLPSHFFPLCFSVEVLVHRLSFRSSPAALGQLQPLSVSARLSARPGPLLRLGQRGSGLRPHRPPPRVRQVPMCTQAFILYTRFKPEEVF